MNKQGIVFVGLNDKAQSADTQGRGHVPVLMQTTAQRRRQPPPYRQTRRPPRRSGTIYLPAKAQEIHRRLCQLYGCPIAYFHALDPLSELVSSLLSHRTRNADSGAAFKALRALYSDWHALLNAPTANIQQAIARVTWPEQKAPRIQSVLRAIQADRGALSLDFLADLPVDEARAWLQHLPGVGPKTSAAVLSFSLLRRAALPVDSHHHRVAQRTGLIPAGMAVGPSHAVLAAQLPPDCDAQHVYDNHEVLMMHGQNCCHWRNPACGRCPLLDLCPAGQGFMATHATGSAATGPETPASS